MGAKNSLGKIVKMSNQEIYILDDKPLGDPGAIQMYRAIMKFDNNVKVAVKRFNKNLLFKEEIDAIREEVSFLKELNHPNIVKYYGCYENK